MQNIQTYIALDIHSIQNMGGRQNGHSMHSMQVHSFGYAFYAKYGEPCCTVIYLFERYAKQAFYAKYSNLYSFGYEFYAKYGGGQTYFS